MRSNRIGPIIIFFICEKVYRKPASEGHFLLANFSQKFDGFADAPHSKTVSPSAAPSGRGIRKPPQGGFLTKSISSPLTRRAVFYSQTFHKSLIKNCEPFGCAFGQRDQKTPTRGIFNKKHIITPHPKGSFLLDFFVKKIVVEKIEARF